MKLNKKSLITITILIFIAVSTMTLANETQVDPSNFVSAKLPKTPSDIELKKVRSELFRLAREDLKSIDVFKKARGTGTFGGNYNTYVVNRGKDSRKNLKLWGFMRDVVEVYQFCLHPFYKVNYVKWCNNSFIGNKMKNDACTNSFCKVCCDHLELQLSSISNAEIIGEKLELNKDTGENAIKSVIGVPTIDRCKARCTQIYPIKLPSARPTPTRDPSLGDENNPALSCADIKEWGFQGAASKTYHIKTTKGNAQVYCDMDTDGGGWTLFFNYRHAPRSQFSLNGTKLPKNLKENSHININNFFQSAKGHVKELRFMCTEYFKKTNKYWHFKTTNPDFVKLAKFGKQDGVLRDTSLMNGYTELKIPDKLAARGYKKAVDKRWLNMFRVYGKSQTGGFYDTPFGSNSYNAYWTILGNDITKQKFECGSNHRISEGYVPEDEDPLGVYTHHSIWFRGKPATPEEAQERIAKKNSKGQ